MDSNKNDKKPTTQETEAAQWLLLAYSLGHPDDCGCEYCVDARAKLSLGDDVAA